MNEVYVEVANRLRDAIRVSTDPRWTEVLQECFSGVAAESQTARSLYAHVPCDKLSHPHLSKPVRRWCDLAIRNQRVGARSPIRSEISAVTTHIDDDASPPYGQTRIPPNERGEY